jgi:hypothetical protein
MGYTLSYKKQRYNLPDFYSFSLDESDENYNMVKDAGIDGNYIVAR